MFLFSSTENVWPENHISRLIPQKFFCEFSQLSWVFLYSQMMVNKCRVADFLCAYSVSEPNWIYQKSRWFVCRIYVYTHWPRLNRFSKHALIRFLSSSPLLVLQSNVFYALYSHKNLFNFLGSRERSHQIRSISKDIVCLHSTCFLTHFYSRLGIMTSKLYYPDVFF